MSNNNIITISWIKKTFFTLCISVDVVLIAKWQGVIPQNNKLKNLYFKAMWSSHLAIIRSKTLAGHNSNAIKQYSCGKEQEYFPSLRNTYYVPFLKTLE